MTIRRRLTLFFYYFKINIKSLNVYDRDFIFGVLSMIITYISGILSLFFIFEFVDNINGWSLYEILFMYGLNLIGYSLWSCFFINTISLPYYIKNGEFDRFLLRPIDPIFQIMMDGFDEDAWGELVVGIAVLMYSWINMDISLAYIWIIPILSISACFIYAGTSILLSTVSFFTISHSNVANLTSDIKQFSQYPLTIYPKAVQFIFTLIIPIAFVSFYPSMLLFGYISTWFFLVIPFVSFFYYNATKKIWTTGSKHYGGTGT